MKSRKVQLPANSTSKKSISDADWACVVTAMGLSGRQADVLALLLEGLNDKEIAKALRISYYTLRTHMRMLLAKQKVDTRLKLVVRAYAILREISEVRPRQDWLANEGEL